MRVDPDYLEILDIQKMIRAVHMLEWQIRSVPPPIRFAGEKGNPLTVLRSGGKGGKILWQTRQRQLIYDPMTLVVPGWSLRFAERQNYRDGRKLPKRYSHIENGAGITLRSLSLYFKRDGIKPAQNLITFFRGSILCL